MPCTRQKFIESSKKSVGRVERSETRQTSHTQPKLGFGDRLCPYYIKTIFINTFRSLCFCRVQSSKYLRIL